MPRIRIRYAAPPRKFPERLEDAARGILERSASTSWDAAPRSTIERELHLTVDRLDELRTLHGAIENEFRGVGQFLQRELELCESGQLRYIATPSEREALRDRLWRVQREQVRLAQWRQDRVEPLQDRLLTLLNRHALLGEGEHGR